MLDLFLKECKMIGKSLVFFILICVVVAFYKTQFLEEIPITKEDKSYTSTEIIKGPPKKVLKEPLYVEDIEGYFLKHKEYPYGFVREEIAEQVIPRATTGLFDEYTKGNYISYPMGFIKNVKLNKVEKKRIEEILEEITGKSIDTLQEMNKSSRWTEVLSGITIKYDRFKELMEEVNEIIGAGSNYNRDNLKKLGSRPRTYEEAMKVYKDLVETDRLTNGYARLFSDYLGIVLGLFPAFVVVFYMLRDRKSNMQQLIYCKEVSSFKLILCRYGALVWMMMVPVLAVAVFSTIKFIGIGRELKVAIDYLAFIKYSIGWLMPTVMAVTALGMFLTILTDSVLAILIQIVWFFISLFTGGLAGNYGIFQLIIRFNTSENRDLFVSSISSILINRLFYVGLSAVLLGAAVYVLKLKREGRIDIYDKLGKQFSALQGKFKNSFSK